MNNDNGVETAIAGLNCWASYATVYEFDTYHFISINVTELNCLCSHAAFYCNWLQ